MKLINTDGLVIFGQGSEWFWSMAQFVVVVVTLVGIYRQLSIARSANAFEQLNRITSEFNSERITRSKLDVLIALRDGPDPADLPDAAAGEIADFWEMVAVLVRAGHVDRRLVHEFLGSSCRRWWAALAPWSRRIRIETDDPRGGEHHEWLAGVMAEIGRKAGGDVQYDEAHLASTLDRPIQRLRDELRLAEELRAGIVRPMSPAAPPTPPSAAQEEAASTGPLA